MATSSRNYTTLASHIAPDLLIEEVSHPPLLTSLFDLVAARPGASFLDADPDAVNRWRAACVGYDPFLTFVAKGRQITQTLEGKVRNLAGDPFPVLDQLFQQYQISTPSPGSSAPGAIGYFGYDLRHHLEKLP
ncbi:MAG: hypothetical protein ACREJ6_04780, partial [Candidatus Methylomirabilis sp.]